MKKTFVEIVFVALAYAFAILFGITVSANKTTRYAPDANIQLLNRYGYISTSELQPLYDHPKSDMSLEEYSAFLDQFLEGREVELQEIYCKSELKED